MISKTFYNLTAGIGLLLAMLVLYSCNSDGDETIALEYGNVKRMIIGEWIVNGGNRVLTFTDDGYYTDSSDGETRQHPWRLSAGTGDEEPYYGGIYLDGTYYDIESLGNGRWILKGNGNNTLDLTRNGDPNSHTDEDNNEDKRINNVLPTDLQEKVGKYITIYKGNNPPNIEGTYLMSPMSIVYCSDGYNVQVLPFYVRFSNQDSQENTLDYTGTHDEDDIEEGKGIFISGTGSNFTAYFNTSGTWEGVRHKTATVISGTKTNYGIKDMRLAIVMVEKGSDPQNKVMAKGTYRVFKDGDGLASPAKWPLSSRAAMQTPAFRSPWTAFIASGKR